MTKSRATYAGNRLITAIDQRPTFSVRQGLPVEPHQRGNP
ncbi:MAG: hypothetical protein Nkreftii_002264 [Candidatus Nitrospira kreftii]|uniref:Uncharacterized protein n=1 Tax=Candidatus Nitrospira kreftii TaxID=2652173 RepID=A0A7S8FEL7_9BACT|nr:MAG: hypothetical protein Nkreftii_002264 [Candidatus Nitrospira kreftii]